MKYHSLAALTVCIGVSAQAPVETVIRYDFEGPCAPGAQGGNLANGAVWSCGRSGDLRSDRAIYTAPVGMGCGLHLDPAQFPAAVAGSVAYDNNTLYCLAWADGGAAVSGVQLCMDVWRSADSVIDGFDLFADEEPGPGGDNFTTLLRTVRFPPVSSTTPTRVRICVDLDDVPLLQQQNQLELRLNLFGVAKAGAPAVTVIDDFAVTGTCAPCVRSGTVARLGVANCTSGGNPVLTLPPFNVGKPTVVTVATTYSAGQFFLMGSMVLYPPQVLTLMPAGCAVYVDPRSVFSYGPTALDAAGSGSFTLNVPNDPGLIGGQAAIQGIIGHAGGLNVSDAYVATVGCN